MHHASQLERKTTLPAQAIAPSKISNRCTVLVRRKEMFTDNTHSPRRYTQPLKADDAVHFVKNCRIYNVNNLI